jgi:lipid-A-disaccharide synthase
MTAPTIMVVAGDPSADANAADLVRALRTAAPGARFIGAGGPRLAEAGVTLSFNLTDDSAIGPTDALKNVRAFWRRRHTLTQLAVQSRADVIILVDGYSFNQSIARAVKQTARSGKTPGWQPKVVRYTSPQVWASRAGRAEKMAPDIDLLLCFFPFEKEWYDKRGTTMRVECVGHPLFDRFPVPKTEPSAESGIVLFPGSRADELRRHLPVMLETVRLLARERPLPARLIAVNDTMAETMRACHQSLPASIRPAIQIQTGGVAEALSTATVALTKTGTVTMECAYFGVPTVTLYKTSPLFYLLARPLVTVKFLSMPNLLAGREIFPEFIQGQATPENLSGALRVLLNDSARRADVRKQLRQIISDLGGPGAASRAAAAILRLLDPTRL